MEPLTVSAKELIVLGCSSQQPTRFRNHGAYLLRWNSEGLLFDPGEGTQRQFIYANVAPTCITRIFISHFHGDHCLGLGSILMRLILDKVTHPIHCYYPASGKKYFDRLRYCSIYHDEFLNVIEHPVSDAGLVHEDNNFEIRATFLEHGVPNIGWSVKEKDSRKFNADLLKKYNLRGPIIKELEKAGWLEIDGKPVSIDDVSVKRIGDKFAIVLDTLFCQNAIDIARNADLLLCESTYLEEHAHLAKLYKHMTAKQAAQIAQQANVKKLVLTHFSARYRQNKKFETEAKEIFENSFAADDITVFPFPKQI